MMNDVQRTILGLTLEGGRKEVCGFVLQTSSGLQVFPTENISDTPDLSFEISPDSWIAASDLGEVVAIYHSHPNGEQFLSGADRQVQVPLGLPWLLCDGKSVKEFKPVQFLRGRQFEYGRHDCMSLVSDAYHLAGIDLPFTPRTDIDSDREANLFITNSDYYGFYRVDEPEPGDVILSNFGGLPSHVALFLGEDKILHHAFDRLSGVEFYSRYWRHHTNSWWRHKDWSSDKIQAIHNDLHNLVEL